MAPKKKVSARVSGSTSKKLTTATSLKAGSATAATRSSPKYKPTPSKATSAAGPAAGSITKALNKQMPGWQIAKARPRKALNATKDATSQVIDQGVTLAQLRRKFLSTDSGAPVKSAECAAPDPNLSVFRIESKQGGAKRIAELVGGKIKIVSG